MEFQQDNKCILQINNIHKDSLQTLDIKFHLLISNKQIQFLKLNLKQSQLILLASKKQKTKVLNS